jgi:hypothetical protein
VTLSPDFPEVPDDLSALADLDFEIPDDLSSLVAAAAGAPDGQPEPTLSEDLEIPDDLADLLSGGKLQMAALVTPVAEPTALVGALALAGIQADVIGSPTGALAVLRDLEGDAPKASAAAMSAVLTGAEIVLAARGDGQITTTRYSDGACLGDVPLPIVLAAAPVEIEDIITGALALSDIEGVISTDGVGRGKALRMIAAAARRNKREQ